MSFNLVRTMSSFRAANFDILFCATRRGSETVRGFTDYEKALEYALSFKSLEPVDIFEAQPEGSWCLIESI